MAGTDSSDHQKDDVLQEIIEGARKDIEQAAAGADAKEKFIVYNCKNVYFAGYENTAVSALWTLMLLALHPEWHFEQLTIILRDLYPPANLIPRKASEEMKFRNIEILKGMNIWISAMALHQDPEIWGADAKMFNPERFANGVLS